MYVLANLNFDPISVHFKMDYLPVVLGRGKPFLDTIGSSLGNSRSVCPRGRLLALVDDGGGVVVYSLTLEGRKTCISSGPFTR